MLISVPINSGKYPKKFGTARICEPDMPLSATTLGLPCLKLELRPVPADAGLCSMFEHAC